MTDTLTGTCRLCDETFGRGISSHVKSCITEHANQAASHHGLLLGVRATGVAGRFWMYLIVQPEASLADLDAFFRDTWLSEDRPSLFDIDDHQFLSTIDPDDEEEAPMRSMQHDIGSVLRPRMEFDYLFDPESPAELECRVFDPYPCPAALVEDDEDDTTIVVLARNSTPEIECSTCDRKANFVCVACLKRIRSEDDDDQQDTDEQEVPEDESASEDAESGSNDDQDETDDADDSEQSESGPWVCSECADSHDGPLVEITNSPRLGLDDIDESV